MKTVTMVQTRDGGLHDSLDAAKRHADKLYGEQLLKIAKELAALEKYVKIVDWLDSHLDDFRELLARKDDLNMEVISDD